MPYYIVTAACGHVGKGKYLGVDFPVCAQSAREASAFCRAIPRVKHNNKNAIIEVRKVSYGEFLAQRRINNQNDYLKAKSKRDCLVLGVNYDGVSDLSDLKPQTNWKRKNDKQYESKEERKHCKKNMAMYNDKLERKEIFYEIGFAV